MAGVSFVYLDGYMKVATVIWGDAHFTEGESSKSTLTRGKPYETHSVGWVIAHTKYGITLAQTAWPSAPDRFGETLFIPESMIVKVEFWEQSSTTSPAKS